jgi:predicted esterase
MIESKRYVTPRTTRFAQIGKLDESTTEVIFALHGWGQLAENFAEDLIGLAQDGRLIICPEALSKFYVDFQTRQSGASWMTSFDREFEIIDYVTYLDGLAEMILEELPKDVHVEVLAFSQGCHTASRWVGNGLIKPKRLILWGSDPAEDLSPEEWEVIANVDDIVVVAGTLDRFVAGRRLIRAQEALNDHQCKFSTIRYEGGHHLQDSVLQDLFAVTNSTE